jgi:hypothetical protein
MNENEEFLAHFGVMGMRWGQRRERQKIAKTASTRLTKNERYTLATKSRF